MDVMLICQGYRKYMTLVSLPAVGDVILQMQGLEKYGFVVRDRVFSEERVTVLCTGPRCLNNWVLGDVKIPVSWEELGWE